MQARVPELSLKDFTHGGEAERAAFAGALWEGLRRYGFIILKDHAVAPSLLARGYEMSASYFNKPSAEKCEDAAPANSQIGYTPFGQEQAKDASVSDLKEFFQIGRDVEAGQDPHGLYEANRWPASPGGFRETFLALFAALEDAGAVILDALEGPLELSPGYFRKLAGGGNSVLRLLHYPPIPESADPRAVRAAAHEDINLITILVAANGAGLELLDRDGTWLPVETAPENLIVDAGDMLARITNDVIPATTHRVINPEGPNVSRYSMPFFMHPHPEAILSCIESCKGAGEKYPPITADDFLKQRLREIGLID